MTTDNKDNNSTQNAAINDTSLDTTTHAKDASQFGKVAVIYGGSSNERSVSLDSGAAVLQALQNQGVDATHFDPKHQDITELRKFDRVFNVLHGRGGEDGLLQGVLQWFDISICFRLACKWIPKDFPPKGLSSQRAKMK